MNPWCASGHVRLLALFIKGIIPFSSVLSPILVHWMGLLEPSFFGVRVTLVVKKSG
jgi:hypothetical protein